MKRLTALLLVLVLLCAMLPAAYARSGKRKCSLCGHNFSEEETICPECGTVVMPEETPTPVPEEWTCTNCGALNGGDLERCWQCHVVKTTPTPAPAVAPAADDTDPVVITVGDTVYRYSEVQASVESYLSYVSSYYQQYYGYTIDTTNATLIDNAREYIYTYLIQNAVEAQKQKEYGADVLTDEEQAEIDTTYSQYFNYLASYFGVDTTQEIDAETKSALEYYVNYYWGVTRDSMIADKQAEKLKAIVNADVTVTDEALQAGFDAKVEEAKASYESSLSGYGGAVLNGDTIYYRPAGYRMIKNLLVMNDVTEYTESSALNDKAIEQSTAMSDAKTKIAAATDADLDTLLSHVTVEVKEAAGDTADVTLTATAVSTFNTPADVAEAALQQLVIDYACAKALNEAYTARAQEAANAAAYDRACEAMIELAAGADWDSVMAKYTEDTGMSVSSYGTTGYPICADSTNMDSAFVAAAMSIKKNRLD